MTFFSPVPLQAEVMHLTDSTVRHQLFLDVLDGTKALVSVSGGFSFLLGRRFHNSQDEGSVGLGGLRPQCQAVVSSHMPTPVSSLLRRKGLRLKGALWMELESPSRVSSQET